MALRAREIYYFVRVGNYATRPLRALQADFHGLAKAGDEATVRLERLQVQQRRLASQRVAMLSRQARFLPGGAEFENMRARQAQRLIRLQENQRRQLASIGRAEERVTTLGRARYDIETRILRIQQMQNAIAGRLRSPRTTAQQAARLRQMQLMNQRRLISAQAGLQENVGNIAAANAQIANQRRLFEQTKAAALGMGTTVAREEELMGAKAAAAGRQINYLTDQLHLNAAAQREIIALQKQHRWDRIALGARALSDFGRAAQYAGAITLFVFGAMAREAAKFRTKVVLAATQVGDEFGNVANRIKQTNVIANQLQRGLLAQMNRFPASADDMAKASYDIYSSLTLQGTAAEKTRQGLRILEVFQRAAVGGQTKLSEVTNAGITILNQFGKAGLSAGQQIRQLTKFMDQAFSAVRFGRTTFSEFTTMLANAAPAAKAANQSFANMAGTLAFLTRRLPVRQASVAYARLLEILQRSEKGLRQHGVNVRNIAGLYRPLDKIIGDIVARNPDLVAGRKNIIEFFKQMTKGSGSGTMGTIQARRAFVFLVQQYKQYQSVLKSTTKDQGEFWKSFRALQASPEVKWKIFVNQLHALAIEIGQYAIPALIKIIQPLSKAVKWFESLSDAQKKHIATMGVWLGALTLVGGTLAVIIGSITRAVVTFRTFGATITGTKAGLAKLGTEAGAINVLFARRLGIAATVASMIIFHKQTKEVIDSLGGLQTVLSVLTSVYLARLILRARIAQVALMRLGIAEGIAGASAFASVGKFLALEAEMRMVALWAARLARIGVITIAIELVIDKKFRKQMADAGKKIGSGFGLFDKIPSLNLGKKLPDSWKNSTWGQLLLGTTPVPPKPKTMRPDLRTINALTKGYMTIWNGAVWRWDGRQWHRITPKQAERLALRLPPKEIKDAARAAAHAHHQQILQNRSVQEWIKLLRQANKFAAAHPRSVQAQLRAIQLRNELEATFSGAQLQAIEAVVDADDKATKKRINNNKELAKAAIDNMKQVYDQLLQSNQQAFGSIADGVRAANALEWSAIPRASDLLADIKDQVRKFEMWRADLMRLQRLGLPTGMLAQLQEAGPEKEGILKGILKMTPKQLAQYVALWKRGQRDIRTATAVDFNSQLRQWRKHGKNAAIQFMKGMRDEGSYINKEMRRIFTAWLKGNLGAQLQTEQHPHRARRHPHHNAPRHLTVHHTEHIHVHQAKEDLSTSLRKARLAQKNRRANRLRWGNT